MNESPSTPADRRSRKLLLVWASIGAVLALALVIEAFFLLVAWKRGTLFERRDATDSSNVRRVDDNPVDGENRSTDLSPRQPRPAASRVPNDNFVNRLPLDTPAHVTGANAGASNERGERMQSGVVRWGDTLWWSWTAPASGAVTIDTIGSNYDTFLAIYSGTAVDALTLIAQNDNVSEVGVGESLVTVHAREGTEYEIQVGGVFTGGGRGSIPTTGALELNLVMPPSLTITSPAAGSTFLVVSSIVVNVSSPAQAVTNVSLYRGATLLGRATVAPQGPFENVGQASSLTVHGASLPRVSGGKIPPEPADKMSAPHFQTNSYSFVVSNAPVGTNSFYAVATDGMGQVGTSAVVNVLVANVGITLTSPSDQTLFQNTHPVTISAFSMLRTGSITNVGFFVDEQLIAEDSIAPFRAVWNSVASGSHRLTARASDNLGTIYHASPVSIAVARTFSPTGSVWKYLDDGSDQGRHWCTANFNDSSWKSGPAELGYGDGDEATRVEDNETPGFNRADPEHYITTYFRRSFLVTNAAGYADLILNVKRDDGAVVYLNGHEAARFNMNTGAVDFLTLARNAGEDGKTLFRATVPARLLVEATNVVAVEIHQATADSTDISFDMDLSGVPRIASDEMGGLGH